MSDLKAAEILKGSAALISVGYSHIPNKRTELGDVYVRKASDETVFTWKEFPPTLKDPSNYYTAEIFLSKITRLNAGLMVQMYMISEDNLTPEVIRSVEDIILTAVLTAELASRNRLQ